MGEEKEWQEEQEEDEEDNVLEVTGENEEEVERLKAVWSWRATSGASKTLQGRGKNADRRCRGDSNFY